MRKFSFGIGLVVVTLFFAGCWDFAAMHRTSSAEFRKQQEQRLPEARAKAAGVAGLSEAERQRVQAKMPEMHVEVVDEFFPRYDIYIWRLDGDRAVKVAYERLEPKDELAWKVTVEGAKK